MYYRGTQFRTTSGASLWSSSVSATLHKKSNIYLVLIIVSLATQWSCQLRFLADTPIRQLRFRTGNPIRQLILLADTPSRQLGLLTDTPSRQLRLLIDAPKNSRCDPTYDWTSTSICTIRYLIYLNQSTKAVKASRRKSRTLRTEI